MEKVPEILLRWNDRPERLSRSHPNYSQEAFERVKATYLSRWLQQHNPHARIAIWGAGRKTRKRMAPLLAMGLRPDFLIDFEDNHTQESLPVISYKKLKHFPQTFVLSYVNNRGARSQIRNYMLKMGLTEGYDFLLA